MKRIYLFAIISFICIVVIHAADDIRQLMESPDKKFDNIFFGQPVNTRLDLIDYYAAGSKSYTPDELYQSQIRLDSLEDFHARFVDNGGSTLDAYLVTPGIDSLIIWVVEMPIGNGDVALYVDDIRKGATVQTLTTNYSDWIKQGTDNNPSMATLTATIPYVTSTAEVDTANNTIVLHNTSIQVPGIADDVKKRFFDTLRFKWDGKKFKLTK